MVQWSERARRHLHAIRDYIAENSPKYADRTVDRILRKGDSLQQFPRSGHVVPEYEDDTIRQVLEGNYRIIYCLDVSRIVVLAVLHAARQSPPLESLQ